MGMAVVSLIRSYTTIRHRRMGTVRIWRGQCNHCTFYLESSSWSLVLDEMVYHARTRCMIRKGWWS